MNSAAVCTEKCSTKGNPLSGLKAVGGRIADSLKTVAKNNAAMFAGFSMLTAPALAVDTSLRDTIGSSNNTTLDSVGQAGEQVTATATRGPRVSPSGITLELPPNSKCQLKSLSFVFGCKSSVATPGTDLYSDRQLFNGTGTFKFSVHSGPVETLAGKTEGDIYNEILTPSTFSSVMPWGTTTNNPYSLTKVLPLYHATISLAGVPAIETGPEGKKIFIKMYTLSDDYNKQTRFLTIYSKDETSIQDVWVNSTSAGYLITQSTANGSTAFATEFIVDVVTAAPPLICRLEKIDDKWALCWQESLGTNCLIQMKEDLTGAWRNLIGAPQEIRDGKVINFIPTEPEKCFFRIVTE
jgi:hypothetical protein